MPDHTPDPIRDLENFGTGGVPVTPLEPAQVRRLGDRRRARRHSGIAALAAVAVIAAVTPAVLLATQGGDNSPPPAAPPSPTPTKAVVPRTITYPDPGVFVVTAADTEKLTGTSADFKTFIAAQAGQAADDGASCPDAAHGVTVQKYSSAGYAIGEVNACGGYVALWVLGGRGGSGWQEGMGMQDAWDCDTLTYLKVPESFTGKCFDESGDFGPDQFQGLKLGMTAAQVTGTHGTVLGGSADTCRGIVLPYLQEQTDRVDGYISPTKGLALLSARPGQKTPERIGLGSSTAKTKHTYPQGHLANGYWVVPLPGGSEYEFGLGGPDHSVSEAIWAFSTQDCTQ